jgi:ATP-binding cassette, subfamily F, member 3
VAEFQRVAKSYGSKQVFRDVSFTIDRGDRVALVGVNGAGKSTLIKLLAGIEPLSAGEFKLGHNVEADYFAQDQYKALDPEARLLDDLTRAAPMAMSTQTELRGLLGCFLFTEDDVFKRIRVLSGGERNRYALAKCCCAPPTSCCSTNPPTTSTCAPRTCCWKRWRSTPARWCLSLTTATSSISWPRGCLKSAAAK